MKIWILANDNKTIESTRYKEEAKKNGISLRFVKPEDFEIFVDINNAEKIFLKGKPVKTPDVLIPRLGASTSYFALALIRQFEQNNVFVLNSSVAIESAKDKLHTFQILGQKNLPIPKTLLAKFPFSTDIVEQNFSYPFILKKISGLGGKGVFLVKDRDHLEEIQELLSDSDRKQNFIFQEFISTSSGTDIRVFVLGGRVIGAMQRIAQKGFRANVTIGATAKNFPLTPELEWIALEAANALGLNIAGVDILFDTQGFKICEVNSNPGFKGFEPATQKNIPEEVFHFLKSRLAK
jgi:RimK family alpha-L-glutamate ligase